jgi:hypothetical protein
MPTEKIFKSFMTLNWKNGIIKVQKSNPMKRLQPTEIPFEINMKVIIPDKPPMTKIDGEIEISGTKVKEIILESLEDETTIK